jgi:hypothetical protein
LLPHIAEEYHYRITNHLLLKKIISPKRDKIIVQSMEGMRKNYSGHSNASSGDKWRSGRRFRTMRSLRGQTASEYQAREGTAMTRTTVNTVSTQHRIRRRVMVNRTNSHL